MRQNVSGCAWENCFLSADQVDNNGAEDESVQEHDRLAVRTKITSRGRLHVEIVGSLLIWENKEETKIMSGHLNWGASLVGSFHLPSKRVMSSPFLHKTISFSESCVGNLMLYVTIKFNCKMS